MNRWYKYLPASSLGFAKAAHFSNGRASLERANHIKVDTLKSAETISGSMALMTALTLDQAVGFFTHNKNKSNITPKYTYRCIFCACMHNVPNIKLFHLQWDVCCFNQWTIGTGMTEIYKNHKDFCHDVFIQVRELIITLNVSPLFYRR